MCANASVEEVSLEAIFRDGNCEFCNCVFNVKMKIVVKQS